MSSKLKSLNAIVLVGQTIALVEGLTSKAEEVVFTMSDTARYKMYHDQDCCEMVYVQSVDNPSALAAGAKILALEEEAVQPEVARYDDTQTITTFKITTDKGLCTIVWLGTSNGYYSESVSFAQIL